MIMRHSRYRCAPGLAALPLAQRVELAVGPARVSAFASESERRRAWERHREELVALEPPGSRPWAWWHYDHDVPAGLPGRAFSRRYPA
ncbi:MAG: hypothetical protein QOF12_1641 [Solirubrobacteraceae bacterium]|jgi:hypothetical protein|nr:hypothetical protein [Solirubrobacteraceae bacterium]